MRGIWGPALLRGEFMPRPGAVLCCCFGARTSRGNLIGKGVLEIFIHVTSIKFREELLKNGLKFAFFFPEG
jgi:hypothetical protein